MQLIDTQKKIVDYFDNRLFDFFFQCSCHICWFKLLKCEDLLLFFVSDGSK